MMLLSLLSVPLLGLALLLLVTVAALGWPDWLAPIGYASLVLVPILVAAPIWFIQRSFTLRALSVRGIQVAARRDDLRLETKTLEELLRTNQFSMPEWCGYYSYEYSGSRWTIRSCSRIKAYADLGETAIVLLDPERPARRVLLQVAA